MIVPVVCAVFSKLAESNIIITAHSDLTSGGHYIGHGALCNNDRLPSSHLLGEIDRARGYIIMSPLSAPPPPAAKQCRPTLAPLIVAHEPLSADTPTTHRPPEGRQADPGELFQGKQNETAAAHQQYSPALIDRCCDAAIAIGAGASSAVVGGVRREYACRGRLVVLVAVLASAR